MCIYGWKYVFAWIIRNILGHHFLHVRSGSVWLQEMHRWLSGCTNCTKWRPTKLISGTAAVQGGNVHCGPLMDRCESLLFKLFFSEKIGRNPYPTLSWAFFWGHKVRLFCLPSSPKPVFGLVPTPIFKKTSYPNSCPRGCCLALSFGGDQFLWERRWEENCPSIPCVRCNARCSRITVHTRGIYNNHQCLRRATTTSLSTLQLFSSPPASSAKSLTCTQPLCNFLLSQCCKCWWPQHRIKRTAMHAMVDAISPSATFSA